MKKFLTLLCIFILILSLPACSKTEPETPTSITDQPSPTTAEPTPAVAGEDLYPGTPVTLGHLLNAEYDRFSQTIYDEIAEDWKKYDAMDEMERMASSHAVGVCGNAFSRSLIFYLQFPYPGTVFCFHLYGIISVLFYNSVTGFKFFFAKIC